MATFIMVNLVRGMTASQGVCAYIQMSRKNFHIGEVGGGATVFWGWLGLHSFVIQAQSLQNLIHDPFYISEVFDLQLNNVWQHP